MCSNGRLRDRLGALEQTVDALLSCDLTTVPDSELGTSLAQFESRTRTLVGLTARLAHERNHRNGPGPAAPGAPPMREAGHPAEARAAAPNRTSHSPHPRSSNPTGYSRPPTGSPPRSRSIHRTRYG